MLICDLNVTDYVFTEWYQLVPSVMFYVDATKAK